MDVITAVRYALLSPFIVFAIVILLYFPIKKYFKPHAIVGDLLMKCFIAAALFAGLSLAGVIGRMVWYSHQTGQESNQGPLAWIFFFGPISIAVGEFVGFVVWLFTKPLKK
jgi:uncharacterized RDD family membrane protein YckC